MDASRVYRIREDMERAEARRLQPHYIESFFLEASSASVVRAKQREPRRYEVTHVPAPVRNRDRLIGIGEPVLPRYERIAFEKVARRATGPAAGRLRLPRPSASRCDSSISHLSVIATFLRRGTVLVDERDPGLQPRVLFYLEHAIQDASITRIGRAPRRLQADALRRDGCGRQRPPPPICSVSRLSASCR